MRRTIASSLGLGLILRRVRGSDAGSGTLGAALAIPLSLAVTDPWIEAGCVAAVAALGIWASHPFAAGDPGWIVIDETAGAWLATIGLGGWPWAVAWLVARVADITKWPPGVARAERLPGAWGVMADDLVAGAYGLVVGLILTAV